MKALFTSLVLLVLGVAAASQETLPPYLDATGAEPLGTTHLRGKLGNVGNKDDLGTLPLHSESSGGLGGTSAGPQGGTGTGSSANTRSEDNGAINLKPGESNENGGSLASNDPLSDGPITIKQNGDVSFHSGAEGAAAMGSFNDTATVGSDCTVGILAPGGTVMMLGYNSVATIKNTSSTTNVLAKDGNGGTITILPLTQRTVVTAPKPGI